MNNENAQELLGVFERFFTLRYIMQKIKFSYDFRIYQYIYLMFGIIFFILIISANEPNYAALFPFLLLIPYYFFYKTRILTYHIDTLDLYVGKSENAIHCDKIVEISILYFKLNRKQVWKLYYLDENNVMKNIHFVPVNFTFEQYKKVLLQKNQRVKINEGFQSNRIW